MRITLRERERRESPMHQRANAVAPCGLREIHGSVCHIDQIFLYLGVRRISCHAEACGNLANPWHKHRGDGFAYSLGDRERVVAAALRKDYAKLLASVARAYVNFAD